MVQILPARETFGETIGRGLGQGISQGVSQASDFAMKIAQENYKNKQRQRLIDQIEGGTDQSASSVYDQLQQVLPEIEQQLGFKVTPEQFESIAQQLQGGESPQKQVTPQDPFLKAKKYAGIGEHDLATIAGKEAQVAVEEKRAQRDITQREKESKRKEEIAFHQESKEYDEKILDNYKKSINQIESISNIKKALKGDVRPKSIANMFRGMGTIGEKIANAYLTKDEATILGSIPYLIEGWKDIFGVRLSDADLKVIQDKLPDIGKSNAANQAIVNIMEKYAGMSKLRYEIAKDIKEKNKGLRPLGYADKVETQFQNMLAPVRVINPNTGNVIEIPAYQVSDAIKAGATLVNE